MNDQTQTPNEKLRHGSVQRLVLLLANGIAAAEGAQVIMDLYFEERGRDPWCNDNYCRLMDWLKDSRSQLK